MPRLVLQTAMISAFELCKKKEIPIQFAAKVPRLGTIGKNHIQSRFNLSEESVLFFCSESDTFLRNDNIRSLRIKQSGGKYVRLSYAGTSFNLREMR